MTKVKICGLKDQIGLDVAIQAGADYVGFVFFEKSPRFVTPITAEKLSHHAKEQTKTVGLFVNPSDDELMQVLSRVNLNFIQLHGQESIEQIHHIHNKFKTPIIKAVGISNSDDINLALAFESHCHTILLDAKPPQQSDRPGGNAVAFDWGIIKKFKHNHGHFLNKPWFLAGGLNLNNIEQAVAITHAPMIDCSSGVELAPGIKDPVSVQKFIQIAKKNNS